MALFAWMVLLISLMGILLLFISKIPVLASRSKIKMAEGNNVPRLVQNGFKFLFVKFWHFVLEAKDLSRKTNLNESVAKVKKVFKIRIGDKGKESRWLPEEVAELEATPERTSKTPEELYLSSIQKNPNDISSYEGLGRLYLQEKNFAEAAEIFRYLTDKRPEKDIYWSNLGLSLYTIKDYKGSVVAYEKALNANNKIPTRWINLSYCFIALDELPKAVKAIQAALKLDSKNINYLTLLADTYLKAQNKVRADEVLRQVLQIDPTNKLAIEKLMRNRA